MFTLHSSVLSQKTDAPKIHIEAFHARYSCSRRKPRGIPRRLGQTVTARLDDGFGTLPEKRSYELDGITPDVSHRLFSTPPALQLVYLSEFTTLPHHHKSASVAPFTSPRTDLGTQSVARGLRVVQ
jgi:hypothetical protein